MPADPEHHPVPSSALAHQASARENREAETPGAAELAGLARLLEVSTRLILSGDAGELLLAVLDAALAVSAADMGNIQLLERETGTLKIVVSRGFEAPFLDFFNAVHEGQAACGTAMKTGGQVVVDDVATSAIFAGTPAREAMLAAGSRAVQATCLVASSGRLVGMLSTHYRAPTRIAERELHILQLLARQVADAVERTQAGEELRESNDRFRLMVEGVKDYAIFMLDAHGMVTNWNEGAAHMYGYSAAEIVGQHCSKYFAAEDAASGLWQRELDTAARSGRFVEEAWRVRKDGSRFWATGTITALRDADGGLHGFVKVTRDLTERKRAEAALRESQQRFAVLFERAPTITVFARLPHGTIVEVNEAFEKVLGYARQEVRGQTGDQLGIIRPQTRERMLTELRQRRSVHNQEAELRTKSGERRVALLSADVIELAGEHYALVTAQDVTDLRRSEATLREREARLRAIFDNEPECVKLIGPDGTLREMNRAGLNMIEADSFDQVAAQCLYPLVVADDRERFRELTERVFAGESGKLEFQIIGLKGTARWLETHAVPLRDESGAVTSLLGITRDISERKRLQEQLQGESQLQNRMMEALPGMVVLVDDQRRIQKWNKAVERVSGFGADEVRAMSPLDFVVAEDRDAVAHSMQEVFLKGHSTVEVRLQPRSGGAIPYFFSAVQLKSASGSQLLCIGVDVSERQLLEEQLRQAQKMEAFGQLAGGVAHDFNNLLTVISGFSEILLSKLPPQDPMRQPVKAISEAGERAASLTRQMLAFSRQTVLAPKVLDVNAVISDTEKLLRRLIGEDVLLTTALDPTVNPVKVDPGHLGQVLMNLAINARDAMSKGGKLTIETSNATLDSDYAATHPEARPGAYVMVAVSDTGSGMPAEVKARIFEPFFTTKGVGKGTGLGLAVVHGIIKQSGGSIDVSSEPGVGSSFKLYFPAVKSELPSAKADAFNKAELGTETILLVEDEDSVRALGILALQTHGYTVLAAKNGMEALRLAEKHGGRIALVISDVVMPGMDGGELAAALRSKFPRMKVLFVSGYTDDTVVRRGILQEEVEFLQKPYSPYLLARKVREILDK